MNGAPALVKKIQFLDEHIKNGEDRIAEEGVRIGNWRREREALFDSLTDEEKKALSPEPPTAPPPPISAPEETKSEPTPSS